MTYRVYMFERPKTGSRIELEVGAFVPAGEVYPGKGWKFISSLILVRKGGDEKSNSPDK